MAEQHYLLGDRAPSGTCVSWCCSYYHVGRSCLSRGRRQTANASTRAILVVCPWWWKFRDPDAVGSKKKGLAKVFAHGLACLEEGAFLLAKQRDVRRVVECKDSQGLGFATPNLARVGASEPIRRHTRQLQAIGTKDQRRGRQDEKGSIYKKNYHLSPQRPPPHITTQPWPPQHQHPHPPHNPHQHHPPTT
jgi:hypothetical protein